MKTLVLAEKPSVAREIARVLGCNVNKNGGIIGSKYIVTWALGHLVTLAMPEELNPAWKNWDESTLPMIPKKFETRVINSTAKQFTCVKNFLKSDEISEEHIKLIIDKLNMSGDMVIKYIYLFFFPNIEIAFSISFSNETPEDKITGIGSMPCFS